MNFVATTKDCSSKQPYYLKEDVLKSSSYFWIGRGGYGVTHPGNAFVRKIIGQKSDDYAKVKRSQRGQVAKDLLENEFGHIKFVISRDSVLSNLEKDDEKEAQGTLKTRRVGTARRESLMETHNNTDQIRSYPSGVCIEVGEAWALDIVSHLLREDDGSSRKTPSSSGSEDDESDCKSSPKRKLSKRKRHCEEDTKPASSASSPAAATEHEEVASYTRVFDVAMPALPAPMGFDAASQPVDSLYATLFPEESGSSTSEVAEEPRAKRPRTPTFDAICAEMARQEAAQPFEQHEQVDSDEEAVPGVEDALDFFMNSGLLNSTASIDTTLLLSV